MQHQKAPHLADEEESYFISMTDLMVGMLFIFIIMLMSFALNFRVAETVKDTTVEQLTGAQKARAQMLKDIRDYLKNKGVVVKIDERNGVLRLPEEILFSKGEAHLSDQGESKIKHVANALLEVLPCYATVPNFSAPSDCPLFLGGRLEAVFVEGHTDSDKFVTGSGRDNWLLSAERSINTYKALVASRPKLEIIRNDRKEQVLSVSSYGPNRPIPREGGLSDKEYKKANRRIDLRFLMATPRPEVVSEIERRVNEGLGQ